MSPILVIIMLKYPYWVVFVMAPFLSVILVVVSSRIGDSSTNTVISFALVAIWLYVVYMLLGSVLSDRLYKKYMRKDYVSDNWGAMDLAAGVFVSVLALCASGYWFFVSLADF